MIDTNVFDSGTSQFSVLAEQAGTCGRHYSQNIENNSVFSFGSCARLAVEGDTNSWTITKFKDCCHESWFDKYNTQNGIWNSTVFMCDASGALVGTCTRSIPNLDICQLVNTQCIQVMLSVHEIIDIFGLGCGHIVQITGSRDEYVNGIYHICWNDKLKVHVIQRQSSEWGGFMQLVDAFPIIVRRTQLLDNTVDPKLHYDNYCKDMQSFEYYGCSYTTYITYIIVLLCHHDDSYGLKYPDDDCSHSGVHTEFNRQVSSLLLCQLNEGHDLDTKLRFPNGNLVDFNFSCKTGGHLVHADTSFWFVGPDMDLVQIDSVQKCLEVADIILGTGLLNYRMARIPIKSGLHLRAWEQYLVDYPDQRLLQYLTFGFPLSIDKMNELNNHHIVNHFSARQFTDAVTEYLYKKIKERAIVGPVSEVNQMVISAQLLWTCLDLLIWINLLLPRKNSHVWVLRWTLRLMSCVLPLTRYMKFTKSAFWFVRKHILLKTISIPFG